MRNIWTIASREYSLYFATPIAYVVAFVVLVILGIWFYINIVAGMMQNYAPGADVTINLLITLLLFGTPAITARLIAEEQRLGTIELLLTAPLRDYELVIGKWLGGFLFMLTLVAITWIYPLVLNFLVSPGIDQGPLAAGYLGVALFCSALVAVGVAVSSFFSNQIAAFFVTYGIILILLIIGIPSQVMGGAGAELLKYLDFGDHFYSTFLRGIIDLRDIIYYLSLTAIALFIGSMSLETRRWR